MIGLQRLAGWLPEQRWFAGKDRPIDAVATVTASTLIDGDPAVEHLVLAVTQGGEQHYYQLILGRSAEPSEYLREQLIGEADGFAYYDALADGATASGLLACFSRRPPSLSFRLEPGVTVESGLRARPITAEQSNSSVVFGQDYILKLFRRPHIGPNRDLDLHRALAAAGCEHIAQPLGSIHGELAGDEAVFGILQRFLPHAVDGWAMATASVRDLMAEADLHAGEVGGDFSGEAARLGRALAEVHADLVATMGGYTGDTGDTAATVTGMHSRLDSTLLAVPALAAHEAGLRAAFDAVGASGGLALQQVHGDLHLGQTLRSTSDWILIDFEGEPAAPVPERHAQRSPLVDVAGMLRSFDYAAHQHLVGQPADHQHLVRAGEWAALNAAAFCDGYAEAAHDPREQAALLHALVLDKAVYEVGYESTHRPAWLDIPLSAIARSLA
ncbi:MAG: maltokinase N-terminal cap-like domain-containing protein [Sciscionella sp.]